MTLGIGPTNDTLNAVDQDPRQLLSAIAAMGFEKIRQLLIQGLLQPKQIGVRASAERIAQKQRGQSIEFTHVKGASANCTLSEMIG